MSSSKRPLFNAESRPAIAPAAPHKVQRPPLLRITLAHEPMGGFPAKHQTLMIELGNFEFSITWGVLFVHWRYCKLCNGILDDGHCDNPNCPNHE